jgi:hypothetical protein
LLLLVLLLVRASSNGSDENERTARPTVTAALHDHDAFRSLLKSWGKEGCCCCGGFIIVVVRILEEEEAEAGRAPSTPDPGRRGLVCFVFLRGGKDPNVHLVEYLILV